VLKVNNSVFVTGGTGYIGTRLIPKLLYHNFKVTALARESSLKNLPQGCTPVTGNALDRSSYMDKIAPAETMVHLIGTAHPGPGKKDEFEKIDKVSIEEAAAAAKLAGVKHFIYLSVAHPAPVMKDYIDVRVYGENLLRESGMSATFIRPWYVLGPGHYWPYPLVPAVKLFEFIPFLRKSAKRLGFINIKQMLASLTHAVRNPPSGIRVIEVPEIKKIYARRGH
jgi:uncharacterized protein YbjT (DUF2867 family)